MLMRFKPFVSTLTLGLLFFPCLSFTYFPVIDVHAIFSMTKQLAQLKKDYLAINALKNESSKGFAHLASELSGQFGYGDLNNNWSSVQSRYQSHGEWQSWMQADVLEKDASDAGSKKYAETHPLWSNQAWISKVPELAREERKKHLLQSRAASIEASYAYDQFAERQETIHDLSQHIDKTDNTKAAIDLNSRLSVEAQYVQNEQLKQVAILNKQMAEEKYQHLAALSKEESFTDLDNDQESVAGDDD